MVIYSNNTSPEGYDYWLEETIEKLNIPTGEIICFAELQLWNGKASAYKEIGENMYKCIGALMREEGNVSFFLEEDNDEFVALKTGHDNPVNPSRYVFREIKVDDEKRKDLLEAWYYDDMFKMQMLEEYTDPIGHYLKGIYY